MRSFGESRQLTTLFDNRVPNVSDVRGGTISNASSGTPNPIGQQGPFYVNRFGAAQTERGMINLGRPGFVEFEGLEVRGVRDLSHVSEGTLRAMQERGFAGTDPVTGDPLILHHIAQNPAGPLVEIPVRGHSIWNARQHPFGNALGVGLTAEQRAAFNICGATSIGGRERLRS